MRYLLGLACLTIAASLLQRARAYRAAALAHPAGPAAFAQARTAALRDPRSLAALGSKALPFVMFALCYVGIKATLAFVAFEGARSLSWLDLAGFLALLAGYGTWFAVRVKYWVPIVVGAAEIGYAVEDAVDPAREATPVAHQDVDASPPAPADGEMPADQRSRRRAA